MRCPTNQCCASGTRTFNVQLSFHRKRLLYDISNYSFVEADVNSPDLQSVLHQVYDICEDGNIDRVNRILQLAHAEASEMLYPYSKIPCTEDEVVASDVLTPDSYVIKLALPESFSDTSLKLLSNLIHEYLVCRVLADWLSITAPSLSEKWAMKIATIVEKTQALINSRRTPLRRKLAPF